ncbi:MAG: phosphate acyltransferase PlsX [Bacillota bacterium]
MRIALDAMGGDHAPLELVAGAIGAAQRLPGIHIQLVGQPELLQEALESVSLADQERLAIVPATQVIGNEESPAMAVRRKKDSSIVVATRLLREGKADALVTAGSTGAFMAAGLLVLGRLPGVERPALAPILPTANGQGVVVLDIGANMDAKPEHLLQYAIMGSIYAEQVLGRKAPRVGLLNVGVEPGKGNQLIKDTFPLMEQLPINFVGSVEARDLLLGDADVVVTDGFVGNVLLKFMEGMAATMFALLREEFSSSLQSKLGAGLLKPSLRRFKRKLDYSEHGGAPLLGVKQAMVKCHGSSRRLAIENGILQAARFVEHDFVERISTAVEHSAIKEVLQ